MKSTIKTIICILAVAVGWCLDILAWSGDLKEPFASIALVVGVGLILVVIAYPIVTYKNKKKIIDFSQPRTVRQWLADFNWEIADPSEQDIKDLDLVLGHYDFRNWSGGKAVPIKRK